MDLAFRCQQEDLQAALRAVARAISATPTLPVLANVLLAATEAGVTATGYDLSLGVEARVANAAVEAPGAALVPFTLLSGLVDRLPSLEAAVAVAGGQIEIRCGSGLYRLPCDDQAVAEDFPHLPPVPDEAEELALPLEALQQALKGLSSVTGKGDDGRPFMTGVALTVHEGRIEALAGNGHTFGCSDVVAATSGPALPAALLPVPLVREIERMDADVVSVAIAGGIMSARVADCRVIGNLRSEEYPPVRNIIPQKYENCIHVERETLKDAIERLQLFSRLEQDTVVFKISENDIAIASEGAGASGAELVPCKDGPTEGMKIAFGAAVLLPAIKGLAGHRLSMEFNSPTSPVVLSSADNTSRQYIVMPRVVR